MCEVSVEHKDGWKAISILIDSGASDSVAPPGMFPEIKILQTNASRAGVQYTAAGGHQIPNLGMQRPYIHLLDGSKYTMAFQVAGVSKALGAVSRIVGAGNRVIFDDPNNVGSFIENKATGKQTPLRQHNGVYYLDAWVKPGQGYDNDQNNKDYIIVMFKDYLQFNIKYEENKKIPKIKSPTPVNSVITPLLL